MLIGYARVSTARQGEYQESSPALSMANRLFIIEGVVGV